jgi:hypothetical protein
VIGEEMCGGNKEAGAITQRQYNCGKEAIKKLFWEGVIKKGP